MSTKNPISAGRHDGPDHSPHEIGTAHGRVPFHDRIEAVLLGTKRSSGADGIAVSLKEGDAFICQASVGMAPEIGVRVQPGEGICGRCLAEARSIVEQEIAGDIRSVVAVPVLSGRDVRGFVAGFSIQQNAFSPQAIKDFHHLAEVIYDQIQPTVVPDEEVIPAIADDEDEDFLSDLDITIPAASDSVLADIPEDDGALTALVQDVLKNAPSDDELGMRPRAKERTTEDVLMEVVDHTPKPKAQPVAAAPATAAAAPKRAEGKKPTTVPIEHPKAVPEKKTDPVVHATEHEPSTSRIPIIVLVIAAILVILVVAYFVFSRKSASAEPQQVSAATPSTVNSAPAPATTNPTTAATHSPEKKLTPTPGTNETRSANPRTEKTPTVVATSGPPKPSAVEEPPSIALNGAGTNMTVPDIPAPSTNVVFGGQRSSGATPARLIQKVEPSFPNMARTMHLNGDVKMEALVGADGRVKSVRTVAGPTVLSAAAVDAVKKWRYEPAKQNGKAVESTVEVTIRFR